MTSSVIATTITANPADSAPQVLGTTNNYDVQIQRNSVTKLTVGASAITTTLPVVAPGTSTNDSAAAGNVGQYVESVVGPVSFAASGTWQDFTSMSLTAGDWDVSLIAVNVANGSTVTASDIGISSTAGNSATGLTYGSNRIELAIPNSTSSPGGSIAAFRVSLASTTTYYAKNRGSFSVATPQIYGRLSARRVR